MSNGVGGDRTADGGRKGGGSDGRPREEAKSMREKEKEMRERSKKPHAILS
jgi:hypothetical protein